MKVDVYKIVTAERENVLDCARVFKEGRGKTLLGIRINSLPLT